MAPANKKTPSSVKSVKKLATAALKSVVSAVSPAPKKKAAEMVPPGRKPAAPAAPVKAPVLTKPVRVKKVAGESKARSRSAEMSCLEVGCENSPTTAGYCRMCYIKNWRKIKRKELIVKEGKLNRYIEELVAKYPDKYIEAIRQDLYSDKEFSKVVSDLELDESIDDLDIDGDNIDALIDNIKRDIDDDSDIF
jgi:hypothetical protein